MQKTGRPKKQRIIEKSPKTLIFSPRGKPGRPEEVELAIDEYEAIRLFDLEKKDQTEGAQLLGISRPSFGRLLRSGRYKVADALVNGKIIRILESGAPFKYNFSTPILPVI